MKENQLKNHDELIAQKIIYSNIRYTTDINFRLICKTRSRILQAHTYRKWIENQMTPEMNWLNIEVDHVNPICLFDLSNFDELKEVFCWKNTQPLSKQDHQQKGTKYNFLDYRLQFIKAYQFMKLNDREGLNQVFVDEIYNRSQVRNYPTNKLIYNHVDDIWSIDLADMVDYKISNKRVPR